MKRITGLAALLLIAALPAAPQDNAATEDAATDESAVVFYSGRSGNKDIYRLDPGAQEPINLTRHPAADLCPAPSPDGRRIAFLSDRDATATSTPWPPTAAIRGG